MGRNSFSITVKKCISLITEKKMKLKSIIVILHCLYIAKGCPEYEDLYPCFCDWYGLEGRRYSYTEIHCINLNNNQDLAKAATALIGYEGITSFNLKKSIFTFIPSNTFQDTKIPEIVIESSSLMALTDTDIAFEGLEDSLKALTMKDSTLMTDWDWSIFRNLKKLQKLSIENGDLESIEDFGKINMDSLNDISFIKNRISFIHSDAFSNCKNLKSLKLTDNEISEMERSMFPNPAPELTIIDLSYNKIQQLPEDMFTNMPKLERLFVAHNNILTLDEDTYTTPWSQLALFDATGNPLRCDCRLSWILKRKSPSLLLADCAEPQQLNGKNFGKLKPKDLWCLQ